MIPDTHVALVEPDSRGRFNLRKWMFTGPVEKWRVYRSNDGKTIRLDAIESGGS